VLYVGVVLLPEAKRLSEPAISPGDDLIIIAYIALQHSYDRIRLQIVFPAGLKILFFALTFTRSPCTSLDRVA
jgi:hypothetical protein